MRTRTIGAESAYNVDTLLIDGNTGTQLDVPPHSVARPELKREKSGPLGLVYTDKIEPWQFGGEACVVDVRDQATRILVAAMTQVQPDSSASQRGIPQCTLFAWRDVRQETRDVTLSPCRPRHRFGDSGIAQQLCCPGNRGTRGKEIHLHAPCACLCHRCH